MGKLDGRCLCGSVTYTCDAEPAFTAVCHCTDCQRQTGTAFSVVVGVPADAFHVSGDTLASVTTVGEAHGGESKRNFCSACGSPIYTDSAAAASSPMRTAAPGRRAAGARRGSGARRSRAGPPGTCRR